MDNNRKVEISFGIDPDSMGSFSNDLTELERRQAEALKRMQGGIEIGGGSIPGAPPPPASHEALQNALGGSGQEAPWRELTDVIRRLTDQMSENTKAAEENAQSRKQNLAWLQANAMLQLGNQTVNQVAQGNFFSAAGGAIGGLMGLPFGPGGMAMGSTIGGMAGNFLQGLSTGASGARSYAQDATDLARRFGDVGSIGQLSNYGLGSAQGYKAEETLSQMSRLQSSRIALDAGQATDLVPAIQQLTRALGLNADATIDLYEGYVKTGGDRGRGGFNDYMGQLISGAIAAGFESNIAMYGELMNSTRTQSVMASGSMMSNRAFGQLQGLLANLTGTSSDASRLFRDNPQMAQMGMNTFMSMGGANDPFSLQAGYMRLAGISENQIDRRFTSQDVQMGNANKVLGFLSGQMMDYSGMSRAEFQAAAASDPNFVRSQMAGNVNLQRIMGNQLLPGLIGRDASAQDIRAFEQLSNIAIANGGQLPMGGADGNRVNELLSQLNSTPADEARQAEAERHNMQMEVMSNFQNLMTKTDQWMANIYSWISENLDLEAIEKKILEVMDSVAAFVEKRAIPFIQSGLEAAAALTQWAKDNNLGSIFSGLIGGRGGAAGTAAGAAAGSFLGPGGAIGGAVIGNIIGRTEGLRERVRDGEFERMDTSFAGNLNGPLGRRIQGWFNDTPGDGVTAREGYNTFQFAPGDQVFAFQGGGTTLSDIGKWINDLAELVKGHHAERMDMDTTISKTLALSASIQDEIFKYQEEQTTKIFPLMNEHLGLIADLVPSMSDALNTLTSNTADIGTMLQAMQVMSGGMAGGTMGGAGMIGTPQFPIRGMTLGDARITSGFGWRNIFGRRDFHEGIDIGVSGGTDVLAARDGVVSQIKPLADQLQIAIQSVDAQGRKIEEWYIHTADAIVGVGDRVTAGQKIAEVARTTDRARAARVSTGDHLDYRVRVDGEWVDPRTMLRELPAGGAAPTQMASGGGNISGLTVKGRAINQDQYAIAQRIYQRGKEMGATDDEIRAAIATAIQESVLTNLSGGDRDSLGIFQQRPSMEWGARSQIQNLDFAIESFFEGRGSNPGMIDNRGRARGDVYRQSHLTQRSAHPDAPRQWDSEARALVQRFSGGGQTPRGVVARNIAYTPSDGPMGGGIQTLAYNSGEMSPGGAITLNITVNVDGGTGNVRQQAYEGTAAAVDEFEKQWRSNKNSRKEPKSAMDFSYS